MDSSAEESLFSEAVSRRRNASQLNNIETASVSLETLIRLTEEDDERQDARQVDEAIEPADRDQNSSCCSHSENVHNIETDGFLLLPSDRAPHDGFIGHRPGHQPVDNRPPRRVRNPLRYFKFREIHLVAVFMFIDIWAGNYRLTAMNERYRGGKDVIIDLPEGYDIEHIDWLAVYCYKFRVDFGHVTVSNISSNIPPFVPSQKRFDDFSSPNDGWSFASLLGTDSRKNFTFQLGVPGGHKGYQAMARARPAKYVWYVNGMLADIYLKRGVAYTFIIEGGNDKSTSDFYNPLYICDDQFGGYGKLSNDEREQVKVLSAIDPTSSAGRLCVWSNDDNVDPDQYSSFGAFRKALRLKCETDKGPAVFRFAPDHNTPDTIYYQSYSSYNMGYKIHVVDELPSDISDIKEEPYQFEQWLATQQSSEQASGAADLISLLPLLCALFFL